MREEHKGEGCGWFEALPRVDSEVVEFQGSVWECRCAESHRIRGRSEELRWPADRSGGRSPCVYVVHMFVCVCTCVCGDRG